MAVSSGFAVVRFGSVRLRLGSLRSGSPRPVVRFGWVRFWFLPWFGVGVVGFLAPGWGLAVVLFGSFLLFPCWVVVVVLCRLCVFAGRCALSVVLLLSLALAFPPGPWVRI